MKWLKSYQEQGHQYLVKSKQLTGSEPFLQPSTKLRMERESNNWECRMSYPENIKTL